MRLKVGELMGMTDRQFDAYQRSLLRELKRIEAEIAKSGVENADLDNLIKDIEEQLKRP